MAQESQFFESPLGALAGELEDQAAATPTISAPTAPPDTGGAFTATPATGSTGGTGGGKRPSVRGVRGELPTDRALLSQFQRAATKYKMPINVLMALAQQESGYNPMAVGAPTQYGRAKGIMQNLDSTAKGLGINPFDTEAAINGAARQYAERIAKGYSPVEAVRAHFGSDDRKQWGPKTQAYGLEVMKRAADIGQLYAKQFTTQPAQAETLPRAPHSRAPHEPGLPRSPRSRTGDDAPAGRPTLGNIIKHEISELPRTMFGDTAGTVVRDQVNKLLGAGASLASAIVDAVNPDPTPGYENRLPDRKVTTPGLTPWLQRADARVDDFAHSASGAIGDVMQWGAGKTEALSGIREAGKKLSADRDQRNDARAAAIVAEDRRRAKLGQPSLDAERKDSVVNRVADSIAGWGAERSADQSKGQVNRDQALSKATDDGVGSLLGYVAKHPIDTASSIVAPTIPYFIPGGIAGRGAGFAARTAGASEAMAGAIAGNTAIITGGAAATLGNSQQVAEEVAKMDPAQLQQLPSYKRLIEQGMNDQQARAHLADRAYNAGLPTSALFNLVTMGIPAKMRLNVFEDWVAGRAPKIGGASRAARIGTAAAIEGLTEIPQGMGDQLSQNLGEVAAGARTPDKLGEKVVASGVLEGLVGAGMGAGTGAFSRHPTPASAEAGTGEGQGNGQPNVPMLGGPSQSGDVIEGEFSRVPPTGTRDPDAAASAPGGMVGAAVKRASDEAFLAGFDAAFSEAEPSRVTARTPLEGDVSGTLERYKPDGKGGWSATILGDDGQLRHYTQKDGVQLDGLPDGAEGRSAETQKADAKDEQAAAPAPAADAAPAEPAAKPDRATTRNLRLKTGQKNITFPDAGHASLFDFASQRAQIRTTGTTVGDKRMAELTAQVSERLSAETGIPAAEIPAAADAYRRDVIVAARGTEGEAFTAPSITGTAQAAQAAPVAKPEAKPKPAPKPKAETVLTSTDAPAWQAEAAARWTRATDSERAAILSDADMSALLKARSFDKINTTGQKRLSDVMARRDGAAPAQKPTTGLNDLGDAGKAIADNFYGGWFDHLEGKAGSSSAYKIEPNYAAVKEAHSLGMVKSVEDLRALLKGKSTAAADRVAEFKAKAKAEAAPAKAEKPAAAPAEVKWFGSQEKADAHIAKKGLAATHEVVQNDRRFEIQPKAQDAIAEAAAQAATSPKNDRPEPTQAQKEAGNYAKGHVRVAGMDVSIENPAGTRRQPEWKALAHDYGYIRRTEGADGDHVDVFLGPDAANPDAPVYVIDQINPDGSFDEHKVMLGFDNAKAAREGYLANYQDGWKGLGGISKKTMADFKAWVTSPDATKPLSQTVAKKPPTVTAEGKLENGTAPEHVQLGVDDRELGDIVEEFNSAQSSMIEDGHPVTRVFQKPKPAEVVRLAEKAKVYHKDHGWMTVAEAKAQIAQWKAHAQAQYDNPAVRSDNSQKVVLSLFDLSGEWSKPWEEAGYNVYRFDIQDNADTGDVNKFSTEFFGDWFGDFDGMDVYAVLAACPCTDFAVSGARHFAAKDADGRTVASVKLVHQTLATIEYFKPAVWGLENPVGRIEKLGGLPPWRLSFDPNHVGDPYTKKTLIWGRFNGDLPIAPVEPTEGSKMHRLYGGKSQATKNARSVTPEGFAYSFFMANNAADHPAMALSWKFDRLDAGLIDQAIKAGVTPEAITDAVEDHFYDMDDEAANQAIRDLLPEPPTDTKADPAPEAKADRFAGNKLFTSDAVEKARARLASKLNQLNSGFDPELMLDGIIVAGAYIEAGVRAFPDYAKAMTSDLGAGIRPFLLSFYEGVRNYPGLDTSGMTPPDDAARMHRALVKVTPAPAEAVGTVAPAPKERKRATGTGAGRQLRQDWGTASIDGHTPIEGGKNQDTDYGLKGGIKDAFLADAKGYLREVAAQLEQQGFTAHAERGSKKPNPVSINEGGPAVSGDVSLTMQGPNGTGIYATIGATALRGVVPTNPQGISLMFRTTPNGDRYGGRSNQWAGTDLTAGELAETIRRHVERDSAAAAAKGQDNAGDQAGAGQGNAGQVADGVPAAADQRPAGSDAGQSGGAARAEPGRRGGDGNGSPEPAGQPAVPARSDEAGAVVRNAEAGSAGDRVESGHRANRRALGDYRYQPGELARDRSWKGVAERNVQAVELVKQLADSGRPATPDERALLARFTGWGASEIANGVFPDPRTGQFKPEYRELGERLRAALTDEEYAAARRTTQYAHYTSEGVIRSIYGAMERFGFAGGRVLEPGAGIGLFKGLMPDGMASNTKYHGIEFDPITGAIAQALYPQSNIQIGDFTQTAVPKGHYDAAIGNPPFASVKVTNDPEYRSRSFMLHDYFFAKTIDRVRPGGLVVFVTSKGTMDKASSRARLYLADRADLLGAIRLPQTAFKDNAGTEVVTDVLFLQRRAPGAEPNGIAWTGTESINTRDGRATINEYFAAHPEMVLGEHALTGSMYRKNEYTVIPRAGDIEQQFAAAVARLPEGVYRPERGSTAERAAVADRDFNPKAKKEGSVYVDDAGALRIVDQGSGAALTERTNSAGKAVPLKPKEVKFLADYVGLRDALKQTQFDQLNEGDWETSLAALNTAYDAFVKKHGPILAHTVSERDNADGTKTITTRWKNNALLRLDAEDSLVRALEDIREDGSIVRSKLLTTRTLNRPSEPTINSVQDALLVALNQTGRLSMADVAKLAGTTEQDAIAQLGDAIYSDPASGWVTADAYLSGNVVRKLKEARQAAKADPALRRNVAALEAVQPAPLAPTDISAQLGAHWIPASDVASFASEVLGQKIGITYHPLAKSWSVNEEGPRQVSEWNMSGMPAADTLEAVLNNRQIKVTRLVPDGNGRTVTEVDPVATEQANNIAKKMRGQFGSWLWSAPQRADRLAKFYNEHYNNIVPRSFDGRHLTLPGISSRFDLYPHQKRAIWRVIQDGNTYLAHTVGAGKTFTMIAAGMEERRLGLTKRPMYVVPNHMLSQFAREFYELYPTAHVMVADEENFHTSQRRQFVARASLNDPDAIVITHSAFSRISMGREFTDSYVQRQIDAYEAIKEEAADDRITVKQAERRIEALEKRLSGKADQSRKDNAISFEELGVDRLFVDEFHEFRKLDFPTNRSSVKGIDSSGSQRAMDLHMKVQYLEGKKPGRSLVPASGTPVTNTMGELFTAQRFMQPEQLAEDGIDSFDAWSAQFGEVVEGFEQNAAGGYEIVSRFAKFVNVPDLMRRVRSFMDILTSDQLGDLVQRPTVEGGGREIVVSPVPDGYRAYQKELEARIKAIRARKGKVQPGDDIILSVISDGRFSAIDMRFVDPTLPSDPNSKLNRMLDDVIRAYHDTTDWQYHTAGTTDPLPGGAMMVFTDIGLGEASARNRGFDMKAWISQRLLEGGVAPEHIAFMRENKAHAKKEKLFSNMRQGKARILIGGKDMETGVNAQKRLTDLFHLDAPWFPASVEQREGRIIRQGNQNKAVRVRAYATKGSYDSTMWGMNARKQRFITQALQGNDSVRSMEDVSEASSFEMASALASGDERYLKLAGLRSDVERLGRLYSAYEREQRDLRSELVRLESGVKVRAKLVEQLEDAISRRKPVSGDAFAATIDGVPVTDREDFGIALYDSFKTLADANTEGERVIGKIGGFDIVYSGTEMRGSGEFIATADLSVPGDPSSLLVYPIDPNLAIKGLAIRASNQVNNLDRTLADTRDRIEQMERRTEQVASRIGATFPEMAELTEKQQGLADLEVELATENVSIDGGQEGQTSTTDAGTDAEPTEYLDIPESALSTVVPEPARVRTLARLKKLRGDYSAGKIDEAKFISDASALADAIDDRNLNRLQREAFADRVRGPDWIRERILRARRIGELEERTADFALWLLDQNPDMAHDLGLSIRAAKDHDPAGKYNPAERVATLFVGNTRPDTATHEILHHTERMMPADVQQGIVREHRRAVEATWRKSDPAVRAAIEDLMMGALGDRPAWARAMKAFENDTLDYATHYQLTNASEFWAVNATDILGGRFRTRGSWIGKARQWIGELIERAKGMLGLRSDAPVLRGLRRVMNGNGDRLSSEMLAERAHGQMRARTYNDIAPEAVNDNAGTVRDAVTTGPLGESISRLVEAGAVQFHDEAPAGAPQGVSAWTDAAGNIHLLNSVPPEIATAVLTHEAFHGRVQPLIGDAAWNQLLGTLGVMARRAARADGAMGKAWTDAMERVQAARRQGDPNVGDAITAEEFGAYAIENADAMPSSLKAWGEKVVGAVQAWALRRFGKQLGNVTPQQLRALAVASLTDAGTAQRMVTRGQEDVRLYSTQQREEAVKQADAETGADTATKPADPSWRGKLNRDISRARAWFHHPRHIAAIFREFTPVYLTAMDQSAARDNIITDLNRDYEHYAGLTQEGKERVNAVLELGRLTSKVFDAEELTNGVTNPGFRPAVRHDDQGNVFRFKKPIHASASQSGQVIKLTAEEVSAYGSIRAMFDRALDMFANQAVEEMGFPELAGAHASPELLTKKVGELTAKIEADGGSTKRLIEAAKFLADIGQSKRSGYVPFSRYGDYVIAVKTEKAKLDFIRSQEGGFIVRGVPASMVNFMEGIGATENNLEDGWHVTAAQRKLLTDENNQTVYAERVETGLRDMLPEARAKWMEGRARDIPSVAKAFERIQAEWGGEGSGNVVLEPFRVDKKRPEEGIKLTDLDTLANMSDIDSEAWGEVRDKLQDAIQAKSFRKHFFGADNVPGYSKDFERSMTDYMASMAGYLARRQHMDRWDNSIKAIKAERLHEYAKKYRAYTNSIQEEFALLRQAGFLNYIAGSVASGFTNLTQLGLMTFPVLSQVASPVRVAFEMARASKDVLGMFRTGRNIGLDMFDPSKAPADVRDAVVKAWESGDFVPQATFEIMATANQRNIGARKLRRNFDRAAQVVGLTFSVPERINRLTTFIAAYRLAQNPAVKKAVGQVFGRNELAKQSVLANWSPATFAEYMVDETQFRMGKNNRPTLMRGIGAPILQFKGFVWQSLEAWSRMIRLQGKRGALAASVSISIMLASSGMWGFPFADDARRVMEGTLEFFLERDVDLKNNLRQAVYDSTGSQWMSAAVGRGAPFASGLDMGRIGMGSIAPDSDSLTDMLGIPYDLLIKRPIAGAAELRNGNPVGAVAAVSPNFVRNMVQAGQYTTRGVRDSRGKMVIAPEQLSNTDVALKALGWTPTQITNQRDYNYAQNRMQTATDAYKARMADRIAKTLALMSRTQDQDTRAQLMGQIKETYADIEKYNASLAPENRVAVSPAMIRSRVQKEMMGSAAGFGRERKQARGAAAGLREVYGVGQKPTEVEE